MGCRPRRWRRRDGPRWSNSSRPPWWKPATGMPVRIGRDVAEAVAVELDADHAVVLVGGDEREQDAVVVGVEREALQTALSPAARPADLAQVAHPATGAHTHDRAGVTLGDEGVAGGQERDAPGDVEVAGDRPGHPGVHARPCSSARATASVTRRSVGGFAARPRCIRSASRHPTRPRRRGTSVDRPCNDHAPSATSGSRRWNVGGPHTVVQEYATFPDERPP